MLHRHHRKLRRHGDERPVNIMHVTTEFHDHIHRNPAESYVKGWMIHSYEDPEDILPHGFELDEDGWHRSVPVRVGEPSAQSGAGTVCPKCKGKGKVEPPPEKLEKPRQRKTLGIRLPVDAGENGIEVLESLLTVARDELKETMGWSESVPAYYVLTAVLHDWITGRATSKEA